MSVWSGFSEDNCYGVASEVSNLVSEVSKPSAGAGWQTSASIAKLKSNFN